VFTAARGASPYKNSRRSRRDGPPFDGRRSNIRFRREDASQIAGFNGGAPVSLLRDLARLPATGVTSRLSAAQGPAF